MRIGMVTSASFPPKEGMGHYIWNLAEHLVSTGHEVDIITRGGVRQLKREDRGPLTIWRPFFIRSYPVHVHLHALFVNALVRRLEREIDLFHLHSPLPPPIRTIRPVLLTVHSPMRTASRHISLDGLRAIATKAQTPISVTIENELLRRSDRICAVSAHVAEALKDYGIDSETTLVMGNAVDTNSFSPPSNHPSNANRVLYVGRLDVGKGLEDLVEAAPKVIFRLSGVEFVVAGEGPSRSSLLRMIKARNLEGHFRLIGHVSAHDELVELYRSSKVFVLPSHYEGLPTVLLEAMACGRPVVATGVGGVLDVIEDGVNGKVVPPRNPEALAGAILQLLQDRVLAKGLGSAAREAVQDKFTWPIVAAKYMRSYRELVAESAA